MIDPISIAGESYGAYVLAGVVIGVPSGYAFAMKTVLKQAKEIIKEQKDQIKQLKEENGKYIGKLIKQ